MTIAETPWGRLRGAEIADGVLAWRGIPYARPPLGELRLRRAAPAPAGAAPPWRGIRDAAAYGRRSLQPPGQFPDPGPPSGEDCLYLNVTAPAGAQGRPALFWVHGGGYETGSGTDQAGDGAAFAASHGLVVVTFNYRLGALGFLDVEGEEPAGALGLHDQIAALRWTHRSIAGSGGDPGQITVYGLSAGGKTVTNLLASPLTRGMIRRAAESSGGDHVKSRRQARALAARFSRELGTTPDKIRAAGARDILRAQMAIATPPRSTWIWRPSVDGAALTARPLSAIAAGAAAGIPLLAQTCARERRRRRGHLARRRRPVRAAARRLGLVRRVRRPGLAAVYRRRPADDDLRPGGPVPGRRPLPRRPRGLGGPGLAARRLVALRRRGLTPAPRGPCPPAGPRRAPARHRVTAAGPRPAPARRTAPPAPRCPASSPRRRCPARPP